MTVDWYQPGGIERNILRHPLNCRKQTSVKKAYAKCILKHGVVEGCRSQAWLVEHLGSIIRMNHSQLHLRWPQHLHLSGSGRT